MGLLDGDLKDIIGDALDFVMIDLTLIKVTPGTYNPVTDSDASTTANIGCRGMVDRFTDYERGNSQGLIEANDRKILVLAKSLNGSTPTTRDRITAEGTTYQIINIDRDPASATFTIQART